MKNFYRLIQGDCLKVLPTLEDESVDLIITDPPYFLKSQPIELNGDRGIIKQKIGMAEWDKFLNIEDYRTFTKRWVDAIIPKLKKSASLITFFRVEFLYFLYNLGLDYKRTIFYIKKDIPPQIRKRDFRNSVESIAWLVKGKYKFNFLEQLLMRNTFFSSPIKGKQRVHLAQKPEDLILWLIQIFSDSKDIILDPFLGSGTTMKVAQDLGRNCIGIEISEKYCDIIKKRCFSRQFLDREVEYQFEVFK